MNVLRVLILCVSFFQFDNLISQNYQGDWKGTLKPQGSSISLGFNIFKKGEFFYTTMEIPSQGVKKMRANDTEIKGKKITITFSGIDAEYYGILKDTNLITGEWRQGGKSYELRMEKVYGGIFKLKKQTPKKPYPYFSEEVVFGGANGKIKFAGTFVRPDCDKRHPVVVLITGSGTQDRDESIGDHKPFAVLADHLAKNGIAVLRCDDRGAGGTIVHPSLMDSFTTEDLAADVEEMVRYLKSRNDIDTTKMGLIGHSEGGIIAPMVAVKNSAIHFTVLMAPPMIQGKTVIREQNKAGIRAMGYSNEYISSYLKLHDTLVELALRYSDYETGFKPMAEASTKRWMKNEGKKIKGNFSTMTKKQGGLEKYFQSYWSFHQAWIRFYLNYNPIETIYKLNSPTLVLFGGKDIQVDADMNAALLNKMIMEKKGPKNLKIHTEEKLNHLFQECKACTTEEYYILETTMETIVLDTISSWIKEILN
jgi:pimeloyl-ACP methyl ester carboxylesterase